MRTMWTEKARRLAEEHELYDAGDPESSTIDCMLSNFKGVKGVGIIDEEGRWLWWTKTDGVIDVEVVLR